MEKKLVGKSAQDKRKEEINHIMDIIVGNHGWIRAFVTEFPEYDSIDGKQVIDTARRRVCSDADFHTALHQFYTRAVNEQPEWFKKQLAINITDI